MEETLGKSRKSISIFGAFALSIGTAIGLGSFVVTGTSYLSKAGPVGSTIGLIIGMLIMIVMAYNYHYLMNKYPNSNGGIYTYTKNTFGADHAFLASWFLIITYFAILWANATSISLFARYLFGSTFQFGFHYQIGGYDVYLGEILLSSFFICLFGGICLLDKRITTNINFGLALIFISAIVGVFIVCLVMHNGGLKTLKPDFALDGNNEFVQILGIISMSPWAFIGFESISNSSKDLKFKHKNVFKVLLISVILTTLIYILMCQISISVFPNEYENWYEYLNDTSSLSGLNAIPAFYVATKYMGFAGKIIFIIALLSIIMTSLIGNMYGLSHLLYSMAEDEALPHILAKNNKKDNPVNAIIFIVIVSCLIAFIGRAAIGWIVDVNTIGGSLVYGYISACAISHGRKDKNKLSLSTGITGLVFALIFGLLMIIPNLFGVTSMAKESFFIFVIWSVAGFIYFRYLLKKDDKDVYGRAVVVWFGLLLLIIFALTIWLTQIIKEYDQKLIDQIAEHFGGSSFEEDDFVKQLKTKADTNIVMGIVTTVGVILLTQVILFSILSIIRKREVEQVEKRIKAEEMARTDALTGVKNKLAYSYKETELNELIDKNAEVSFAIVVCDINDLKLTNDTFGHQNGDKLLKSACSIICKIFKHSPVYRIGGDEFAILHQFKSEAEIKSIKQEIEISFAQVNRIAGMDIKIKASIGVSIYSQAKDVKDRISIADKEMYEEKDKHKRKNR